MILFRRIFLAVLLLNTTSIIFAQQHFAKTLLWRISGNGLQKPSYLFGTMHLTDKRLFNFGDSVYSAIEKTDGLAMEVNADEMAAYVVNKMFDKLTSAKKLQDVLKDKDYVRDSAALSKKFNKPAADITTADIYKEKNKWMSDYLQKGEMPTFVDAYLYSIARKQGKWLGGIEDMSDQAGLIDDLVDKSDVDYVIADNKIGGTSAMENMISTYASQNLEAIESLTSSASDPEMKDRIFIKRNIKMARRIDSLAAFRTMFFAIGAGHLPGDSGVINLLRGRGFTVEPVMSDKKIAADDYKFKEIDIPWVDVNDNQGLYKVSMPGNPAPVKLFGLIDVQFLFDIANFSGYYTMAIISPRALQNNDSLYDALAAAMFKTDKITPSKKIFNNGAEGREYIQDKDNFAIRVQVYYYNRVLYMASTYSMKKANISAADATKFFNSFTINKFNPPAGKSYAFTDSVMGISFASTAAIAYNSTLSKTAETEGWKIAAFSGTDIEKGTYIMLFSKEVHAGRFMPADSLIYTQVAESLKKQYSDVTSMDTAIQGYHVVKTEARGNKENLMLRMYNTILGNRNILLMVIADSTGINSPATQNIFTSFSFLNNASLSQWQQGTAPNGAFTTWVPSAFRVNPETEPTSMQHMAYDTATATSYIVVTDTLSKYTWEENDSLFWQNEEKRWLADESTISSVSVQNGPLQGRDVLTKPLQTIDSYRRKRLLISGNVIYELSTYGDKRMLYSDNANKFFDDFKLTKPAEGDFIHTSKASLLLNDLLSPDSATRSSAFGLISNANFTEKDIPLLHVALFKKYLSLYDSTESTAINYRIAEKLEHFKSTATIDFVKQRYNTVGNDNTEYKTIALTVLAGMYTQESYKTFQDLITQSVPTDEFTGKLVSDLKDSLELTASIYPTLLKLADNPIFGADIADISLSLIDKDLIDFKTVKSAEKDFIKGADLLLPLLKANEEVDYNVIALTKLLAKFNSPQSFAVLQRYLSANGNYVKENIVKLLLQNSQPVSSTLILSLAKAAEIRKTFYDDLKEINKKVLFPAQYLTQQYFAESDLFQVTSGDGDNDPPSSIKFITTKTATYKNKKYTFYLFKVSMGDDADKAPYLGIAGGYTIGSTNLEAKEFLTTVYWDDKYDATKITEQFNKCLQGEIKEKEDEQALTPKQ